MGSGFCSLWNRVNDQSRSLMSSQILAPPRTVAIRTGLFVAAAVVAVALAFDAALAELVRRWIAEEEYSHGFLIPVVSAWLLWTRREALLANVGRPSWAGLAVVLFAMVMHIIGEYSSIFILSQFGFILVLIGIVLAAGGYSLLKVAFLPIVFLIFAIPLPYFIQSNLTLQLQLVSSQLGVDVIRLFQIPVYLEGNIIDLGYYKLQVVEACSGLRYLYPLLSLSFLAAYLFQASIWQRTLVFLSGIPITIAMNGFRIGMVGVTVDRWGPKMADEALHFFEGWVIFIACAALLLAEVFLLARLSGRTFFQVFHLPAVSASSPRRKYPSGGGEWALLGCLILVCATGFVVHSIAHQPEFIPERTRFAAFPPTVGEWKGHTSLLDPDTEQALGVDDYLLSDYSKSDDKPVNLYVAYYSTQRNGYAPHSPAVCIPGGGWLITQLERTSYDGLGRELPLNRVIIEKGGTRQVVYYWFDERGRQIANEYMAKWYLLADAVTKNRTDGSLIRLTTGIYPGETERDADARLQSFMHDVVPTLAAYLPSDHEVRAKSAFYRNNNVHG
jgi:exosortase D (VPLPA-CTERM-specific)